MSTSVGGMDHPPCHAANLACRACHWPSTVHSFPHDLLDLRLTQAPRREVMSQAYWPMTRRSSSDEVPCILALEIYQTKRNSLPMTRDRRQVGLLSGIPISYIMTGPLLAALPPRSSPDSNLAQAVLRASKAMSAMTICSGVPPRDWTLSGWMMRLAFMYDFLTLLVSTKSVMPGAVQPLPSQSTVCSVLSSARILSCKAQNLESGSCHEMAFQNREAAWTLPAHVVLSKRGCSG